MSVQKQQDDVVSILTYNIIHIDKAYNINSLAKLQGKQLSLQARMLVIPLTQDNPQVRKYPEEFTEFLKYFKHILMNTFLFNSCIKLDTVI